MADEITVTVTRQDRYKFLVDFGDGIPGAMADEPPPLGENAGPSPTQLLAAAVANCLSASFIFACNKYKADPGPLTAAATCSVERNEKNRLRVTNIDVRMALGAAPEALPHLDRAIAQFEEFCTVSQSVRTGISVAVHITGPDGAALK